MTVMEANEFDYQQLEDATVVTGKYAPVADAFWFLTGNIEEASATRCVAVNPIPFRVGRRSDLTLCLPFSAVSNLHAELFKDGEVLQVRDLGSTNGTFVNGNPVEKSAELNEGDLLQFANIAFRLVKQGNHGMGRAQTAVVNAEDQALALTRFDELLTDRAVVPHFQPIIDYSDNECAGYEILGRSRLFGLNSPKQMFSAAAQLNLEAELSRLLRFEGIVSGKGLPADAPLFVNTHPLELEDTKRFYASLEEIRELSPEQPITLEIHESAAVNPDTMGELRTVLDELDIRLAYDDFGAGQARLVELVKVSPDILKFDMTLVQNIHGASTQHKQMLSALVQMTRRLGIAALAEGVETAEDDEACREMGFDYGQGFYYGRPAPTAAYEKQDVAE